MSTREDANQIIKLFNLKNIEGCNEPLKVKFADTNEQKKIKRVTPISPTPESPIILSPIIVYQPTSPMSPYHFSEGYYDRPNSPNSNVIPTIGLTSPVYYPNPGYVSPVYAFHPGSPTLQGHSMPQVYSPFPIYPTISGANYGDQRQPQQQQYTHQQMYNQEQPQQQMYNHRQPSQQMQVQQVQNQQMQQQMQNQQMQDQQQQQYIQSYQYQSLVRNHDGSYSQPNPSHNYGSHHSGYSSPGYISPLSLSPRPTYSHLPSNESHNNNNRNHSDGKNS
ncbi:hypothetical protein AYI68_g2365 [Smittium mucronatum]|uniref:Uncharacterized protein n=1 Tax=Smittium mucronatum TaxID=133383 RepID=A0A1R0H2Z2_9FUNG|nr:hypothetical protein AYI68_g2365 [Smittium mucronatum]